MQEQWRLSSTRSTNSANVPGVVAVQACQTPWLTVSSMMSVIHVPLVGFTT